MKRMWLYSVIDAHDVASEVRAYLAHLYDFIDDDGRVHVEARELISRAKQIGRHPMRVSLVLDSSSDIGILRCGECSAGHTLTGGSTLCECGAEYFVEWEGDGLRVRSM